MHLLCTICSDIINQPENLYGTKCGHVFHHHCLTQWLERSKSCPQCRTKLTAHCTYRIYPTLSNETNEEDVTVILSKLDDAQLQLRQQKTTTKKKEDQLVVANTELKKLDERIKSLQQQHAIKESAITTLKNQLDYYKIQNKEMQKIKDENENLTKNLDTLNGLQKVLNATSQEVEEMMQGYTDVRTVATFATALKRALCESESKKNKLRNEVTSMKQNLGIQKLQVTELEAKIVHLNQELKLSEGLRKRKATDENLNHDDQRRLKLSPNNSLGDISNFNNTIRADHLNASCYSLGNIESYVHKIEASVSPYLNLKQSSLALAAVQQRAAHLPPEHKLKPSEIALINAAKKATQRPGVQNVPKPQHSIFNKKEPQKMLVDVVQNNEPSRLDPFNISYDGFGGHSKLDTFPVPTSKQPTKSCVPKLTAKHRLRNPNPPAGNQDISKLLGLHKDKSK